MERQASLQFLSAYNCWFLHHLRWIYCKTVLLVGPFSIKQKLKCLTITYKDFRLMDRILMSFNAMPRTLDIRKLLCWWHLKWSGNKVIISQILSDWASYTGMGCTRNKRQRNNPPNFENNLNLLLWLAQHYTFPDVWLILNKQLIVCKFSKI